MGGRGGRVLLPGILTRFAGAYPHIVVDIREGTSEQIGEMLAKRELDLAIAVFERPPRGVDPAAIEKPLAKGDLSPLAECPFALDPPEDIDVKARVPVFSENGRTLARHA